LEAQGSRLGLNAMLLSLNAVVSHLNLPASALDDPRYRERRDCREQAKRLLRVLDREAHNLRDWDPARLPAAFAQQVYNRAVYEGFPGIREAADRRLRHLDRPCFTLNWRTQHEPAALLRSLDLPRAYAMALVQLPNGGSRGRVLSVGTDRVLQLWRTDTGARLAIFPERHTATIRDLAVTSDGRYALSASFDTTVGVWDLAAGRRVATLAGHTGRLRAVRVTPDDRYAISAGEDNILRVWDLRAALAGEPVSGRVLAGHTGTVWSVAVAPDGRRAASVGDDGRLLLWDLDGGDAPIAQKRTDTALRAVTFLPGQNQVLVGDIAGQLVRLDLDRDTQLALQRKHTSSIFAIAVAGDGSLALTASYDRTVKVWDLREGSLALLHTLSGHGGYVYDVVLSPDGRRAVSAASDGMLKVWQLTAEQTPKRARHPRGHQGTVRSLALMPGAGAPVRAVSSAQDGVLQGWDVEQGRRRYAYRPDAHPPAPHYEVVAPVDGTTFAASALDTTLILRSAADGRAVRVLRRRASAAEPASNEVRGLALAPDRRRVASAAADGRLTLWDLETGASLRTSEAHDDVARVVRFGPDGETLLSGGDDGALKVWDPHDGTLRATCPPPDAGPVRGIAALSADEVLVGYQAGLLAIWRVGQARTVSRMRTPGDGIRGLVVTAGARCVLVAEDRRTLRAWSVRALRAGRAVPDEPLALVRLETGLRSLALDPASGILLVGDVVGGVTCLRYARGAT
jgi:WD40 repeat protein